MTTKHHNSETKVLLARLGRLTDRTAEAIAEAALILLELHTRKVTHPLMRDGVLSYYAEICDGRLSAKAVLAFAGVHSILKRIVGMPLDQQDAFAAGGRATIAEHNRDGKIVSQQKPLIQMTAGQLDVAFDKGIPRPFAEQRKILNVREPPAPRRRRGSTLSIRADLVRGEIICGQLRFTPHQLGAAMKTLGYEIRKIENAA